VTLDSLYMHAKYERHPSQNQAALKTLVHWARIIRDAEGTSRFGDTVPWVHCARLEDDEAVKFRLNFTFI